MAGKMPSRQGELVGVADAGRLDLNQHLALARAVQFDGSDLKRFSSLKGDGGAHIHERVS
jgi:hypothetical protein